MSDRDTAVFVRASRAEVASWRRAARGWAKSHGVRQLASMTPWVRAVLNEATEATKSKSKRAKE